MEISRGGTKKKIDISSHLVFVVKLNCFKRPILKGKNNPVMSLEKKERKNEGLNDSPY